MDRIKKSLLKLSAKERKKIEEILGLILKSDFSNLDVKKLRGTSSVFRVRVGKIRIIYFTEKTGEVRIMAIEKRSDNTYN